MDNKIVLILLLLVSGFAYSQTTVTLQDQCNCEVLSGTAVTVPGMITPAGADTGDIYVNTNTGTIYFWDGNSWELTSTDNQQLQNFTFNSTTNLLSLSIENGNTVSVDLSALDVVNTDDQQLSLAGNTLTLEDGGTVDLSGYLDNTDDQTITGLSLDASNILSITIEGGNTRILDLSALLGTDDQNVGTDGTAGNLSIEDGNTIVLNVNDADADPANEYNTGIGFDGNNLTVTDAGGNQSVDISGVSTDDQTISTDGTAGNLSIEDGNTIALNVNDADADPTNEYNTGVSFDGTNLTVTDAGGNQSVDISGVSTDDQNLTLAANTLSIEDGNSVDLTPYLDNTDDQNLTGASLNGSNVLQIDIENGTSTTVDLSSLDDSGTDDQNVSTDGTAGNLSIEDGNTIALNVNDADADPTNEYNTGVSFDGTNLTVTDAGGNQSVDISGVSTDDQDISGSGLSGTDLTIGIENGASEVVDLSSLVGTDDQNLTLAANSLSIEDGNSVDLTPYLDNTDDQDISGSGLSGTDLTIGIENGASEVVDLSSLVGTDDQNVSTDGTAGNLSIEDGNTIALNVNDADADPTNEYNTGVSFDGTNLTVTDAGGNQSVDISGVSTDDQNLTLAANTLSIEDGNSVDLTPYLDNTDDQDISGSGLSGTDLTIGIENGASEVVDLSSLVGTDDQDLTGASLNGSNILQIDIENGASTTVDLSSLDDSGTDDQNLTLAANSLSIEDGNSVDLSGYLDNTDDQNLTGASLNGSNILQIDIENGTSTTVDLSSLDDSGTDDQTVSTDGSAGNITIEDGNTLVLNVDDADADPTNEINTGSGMNAGAYEITDSAGTLSTALISTDVNNDISAGSDGALYLNVASVTISETITDLSDNGDGTVTYTNENGVGQTISKSDITDNGNGTYTFTNNDGSDVILDTRAASNPYDNSGSGLAATDVQSALDELSAGSTDDQNLTLAANSLSIEDGNSVDLSGYLDNTDDQNLTGASLNGSNILQIDIENGTSTTVDLSSLDDSGTDDQNLTLAANSLSIEDGNSVDLSGYLDNTDDQDISGSGLSGTDLTIGIENGASEVVDLSSLVGTDDQNLTLAANSLSIEDGNSVDLTPYLDNTDNQDISGSGLSGTDLTIGIENGASEVVDLSSLVGTDDQNVSTDGTAGNLSIEDGNTIVLNVNDADADPTNEYNTGVSFDGANLTVTDAGGNQSVDISGVSTDDQNLTLAANSLSIEDGNSVDLSGYLDNTDDQNISGSGLSGTDLTIGIENGASEVVDLSSLVGTDDQDLTGASLNGSNILQIDIENGASTTVDLSSLDDSGTDDQTVSTDGSAGNITIEDGNTLVLNVDDADADPTNEINTGSGMNAGAYEITDSAGTLSTSLISTDLNNDISAGSDGALYLNVASVTISETITNLSDNGDGTVTYTNENGVGQTISKSDITDNGNGTYTFTNNDGSDVILDTRAASNPYDNSGSGLAATDVQSALDELSAGSTDDQNLTLAANSLSIEDGNSVDLTPYLDNTDDQDISGSGLSGTDLTIGIENGASEVVDLSSLVGTDDQNVSTDGTAGNLSIEDGNTIALNVNDADADPTNEYNTGVSFDGTNLTVTDAGGNQSVDISGVSTDDQNLTLAANSLSIEDGNSVDLTPYLDNTDDQDISGSGLSGTDLTIGIENGASEVVDLSSLVGTDDQNISTDGTAGNLSIEDGNTIALNVNDADADPTNEYNTGVSFDGTNLTVTDAGGNQSVDISGVSTDDQNLTLAANTLSIEDGNSVDLTPYLDNTDDQDISGSGLSGTDLTIGIENGASEVVDLSSLVGTDDQNLTGASLNGSNILQIDIENGTSTTVDLSSLDDSGTDDQNLTLAANSLSIEDGNSVDLTPYLDNTDDQNLTGASLNGSNVLQIDIENGTSTTVDLSSLDDSGTDDQNVSTDGTAGNLSIEDGNTIALNVNDADADPTNEYNTGVSFDGTNLTVTDAGGNQSVDISGVSTDDQNLTLAANTLSIEDGNSVDLTPYLDNTDDQDISGSGLSGTNLTIGIENGASQVVDLSSLVGTDDQNIAGSGLSGTNLTIGIENGASEVVDLSSLVGTDDQNLTLAANSLSIEDGNSVDLSSYLDNTDDQDISGSGLSGTDLTIGIENGASEVVDLSSLVGTDDQDLTGASLNGSNILQIDIENGASTTVDLSSLDDSGTDDQNLTLAANSLSIEDGNSVDLSSYLDNTDDQNLTLAANSLSIEDGNSVDLSSYLDNTDDQNISGSGLSGTDLTIGIENGASEVVDLSSLVGTDDQDLTGASLNGSNILQIDIENGASTTVDLSSLDDSGTDDQNLTLAANSLSIEDGNSVDLSSYLDNTDDQNLTLAANSLSIEDGNSVDLSGYLDNTDDQNISGSGLSGTDLTIGIENGASEVVDLSSLVGTDDQNLTLAANSLSIEDGNSVDLSSYLDNTDDQNISGSGLSGTDLTIGIENGTSEVVDLSSLVGTDDQDLTGASLNGSNILQIDIENGASTTVDLSSLDDSGTDDQNLTLAANSLSIEDGNSVDLSSYLDNTDDQNISGSGLSGTDLTIGIENGTSQVVDLSSLVGTDDQDLTGASLNGSNILQIDIENGASTTVDLSSLDDSGTDDQNLTLAANSLSIEDGNSVDLSSYLDNTDDQNISGSGLSGTNLTIGIENGASQVVDLSSLVGTDDQDLTGASLNGSNILQIDIENGASTTVDLSSLDDSGTDDQNLTLAANSLSIEDGNSVDLSSYLDNTDDQNISGSGLSGTDLTIGIENGTSEVVDLSSLVGTDDQNIAGSGLSGTNLTIGIENGTSEVVDLSSLVGTDDQNLTLAANSLSIEDGNSVDLSSYLDNTDDQNLTLAANSLSIEDGNSVDLSSYLDNTDDQNIAGSGLSGTDLTIGIENGTSEVVDLSSLVGTDDQDLTGASLNGSNILQIDIENGASTTVDLSSLDDSGTDDQYDDEVLLRTPLDVNEGGAGSPTDETTVEEVIQAIAPITSKAARIFYPPSIAIDASANGSFNVDLYAQYLAQFGTPTVASSGAPAAVPTYAAGELYYYVTYADPAVFNTGTMSINANGVLSYEIIGQPSDYNSLINVVFVVK